MRPGWNPGRYAKKEKTRFEWKVRGTGWQDHKTFIKGVFILILVIAGVFILDRAFSPPNVQPGHSLLGDPDVTTQLWAANAANNGNYEFKTNANTGYTTANLWVGSKDLTLNPNGTASNGYGIALSKTPFDPSPVSGKHLKFIFWFKIPSITSYPANNRFVMFLTRNATLPNTLYYNPLADPSVALALTFEKTIADGGGFDYASILFIQRVATETIASEDRGSCNSSDSCFLFSSIFYSNAAFDPHFQVIQDSFWLNFTGSSTEQTNGCAPPGTFPAAGNGCSELITTVSNSARADTGIGTIQQPAFRFQGETYYVGFFWPGTSNLQADIGYDTGTEPNQVDPLGANLGGSHSMQAGASQLLATPVTIQPTISESGWFGPVIKGIADSLIGFLVLIINSFAYLFTIINSLTGSFGPILQSIWSGLAGFFWGLIITTMNTVGGLFGAATIGTQFSSFINNSASFIGALITNVLAMGTNLVTLLTNLITWTFGANGFFLMIFNGVNTWLTLLFNLLGSIQKILTMIFKGSTIGLSFLFLFDMLWLIIVVHDDGMRGISEEWWPIHNLLIVSLAKLVFFIVGLFGQYLYWVVSMIELAIEDVKPNVSVGAG